MDRRNAPSRDRGMSRGLLWVDGSGLRSYTPPPLFVVLAPL